MQELDKLNAQKGTATNAMVLFLAINTSSVTLLPTGVVALRAAAGSSDPAGIVPTTLFATICSTIIAIITAKSLQRFWTSQPVVPEGGELGCAEHAADDSEEHETQAFPAESSGAYPVWITVVALLGVVAVVPLAIVHGKTVAPWIVPALITGLLTFGMLRGVPVYECFVDGAKDGFQVALRIIPYLVAILVAVGMFREGGALEILIVNLGQFTSSIGLPVEALPMTLLRPLSGSGAYGVLASTIQDPSIRPDSYVGYLVSTLQGSTETTFYVLAVYFGAVQIRRIRHALGPA